MSFSKLTCFDNYQKWVVKHSDILGHIESLTRMTSYLIAGRVKKSPEFSEFLYSATNIIVFINDQILLNASRPQTGTSHTVLEKCKLFFTILEYLQVFLEISATKLWGTQGKWMIITVIQTMKFLWRLFILIKERSGLASSRTIPPLNRKKIKQNTASDPNFMMDLVNDFKPAITLKSGRIIRTIKGAPQLQQRNWQLPILPDENDKVPSTLQGLPLVGEVIYIAKPLCHLGAMRCFGTSSWLPWLLSLSMDTSSLKLFDQFHPNREEKEEINRRQLMLLMYLLRSPFYDSISRKVLTAILMKFTRLPLIGLLPKHILQYLPHWQKLYSYTWD